MNSALKIFCGNSNPELAASICQYLDVSLGAATVKSFPDGETFVRIDENVRGADVFIIQSTCNPANQHLMELFIMIDAARRASAKRITAVIPFMGTQGRIERISREYRLPQSWWLTCWFLPGQTGS